MRGGEGGTCLEVCYFERGTPLTLVGYEMIIGIYHLIFNSPLLIVKCPRFHISRG